jgi:integrase/recombinase XerD
MAQSPPARLSPLARSVRLYLDHLTVERGLAANSLAAYRRDLARYVAFCEGRGRSEVSAVEEHDVADFLVALRTGGDGHPPLAASSAGRTVVAVRGFHRFAAREGLSVGDPGKDVRPPTQTRRLPKAITVAEVEAILDAADPDGTPRALRDRALLEVLYATGARISEAVGLDIDDLDVETASVLLRGKGSKERIVPVGRLALSAVEAYLVRGRPALTAAGRGGPALFVNSRGGRLTRQSAWSILAAAVERSGVEADVSPHTFRHSFATHLLDGGADVRVVQELLGHASVTTTQIYTLVTVDHLREVYALAHPRARS